ncbi:cell division protein ZapA [Parabacteroides sp. PF5-6]|uniref:cell division protein ZapA n=1 Tax=Parabacteroides sp. PF5-6 TaxID=1742403 RepID=UPI002404F4ED|nr:cell division protein ZapA [Parabacteroides sp. PF5-6]MDF9831031.1 cell division protein ZapA [Parabacteroides sp. PF5-6]
MDEKFLIHVEIGDKTYALRIKRSEEEQVRQAAKQLRKTLLQYRQKFSQSELEIKDLLAMVALQYAVQTLQLKDQDSVTPIADKLQQLTSELEVYLEGK